MPKKRPHLIPLILLALFAILSACTSSSSATLESPRINLQDCQLSAPGVEAHLSARCGSLKVYEDRSAGSGRQISLNIAVIPSVSRNPEPDPLFFLTGGPGQAATESYPQVYPAFDRVTQKREIVLVDQRGTGKSNALKCPNLESTDFETLSPGADPAPILQKCLQSLDANPAFYTTTIAMQDLDEVRAALGYDKINLYGVSYGTRAALTYLRNYPQHVRSVILDGVVPQDEALGQNVAGDAQRALDQIFLRCQADKDCRDSFPNAQAEFYGLLTALEENPEKVSVTHPITGEKTELTFTAGQLASATRLLSYSPETAALLPLLIHTASAQNDFSLLATQYLIATGQLTESISEGMNYSVLCAEDIPFYKGESAAGDGASPYVQNLQIEDLVRICQTWPRGQVPAGFKEPVSSAVPVLLLSGEADPVTPPENAVQTAKTLPNSLSLIAPGQGHIVVYRGCIPRLVRDFIESASVKGLDTACVSEIQPLPFFVNFSGPVP